jgi:hypothetical protein
MSNQRLIGQKAIMRYLGILSQETWCRYKRAGMPLDRTPGGGVQVDSADLKAWMRTHKPKPCYSQVREQGAFASLAGK